MKREITFINCDECGANLSRSDDHWEAKERRPNRDYWVLEAHHFCGEACVRSYYEARIADYKTEWFTARVSAA